MELIKRYISDLKNIAWISYDENYDAIYYQENSVEINSNKRKSKIYKLELQTSITSEVTNGNNDSTPKVSPDGKKLAYIIHWTISLAIKMQEIFGKKITDFKIGIQRIIDDTYTIEEEEALDINLQEIKKEVRILAGIFHFNL